MTWDELRLNWIYNTHAIESKYFSAVWLVYVCDSIRSFKKYIHIESFMGCFSFYVVVIFFAFVIIVLVGDVVRLVDSFLLSPYLFVFMLSLVFLRVCFDSSLDFSENIKHLK